MTLLQSTNRVLRDLREDTVDSLTNEDRVQSVVDALNRAAHRVLRFEDWSFLHREATQFVPGVFTATTGGTFTSDDTSHFLNVGAVNSWTLSVAADFSTNVRSRLRITSSSEFPNTSFIVTNFNTTSNLPVTIDTAYQGSSLTGGDNAFEVYTNEIVLPSTVRQVTRVWDAEGDLELRFGDIEDDCGGLPVRPTQSIQNESRVVHVGGYGDSTSITISGSTIGENSGMLMTLWPPSNQDHYIHYRYVHQHADLSSDADTWSGVPAEHVSLMEEFALAEELLDNRQADERRGIVVERRAIARLQQLQQADRKTPYQRRVMQPYRGRMWGRGYRSRWASQDIDAP